MRLPGETLYKCYYVHTVYSLRFFSGGRESGEHFADSGTGGVHFKTK